MAHTMYTVCYVVQPSRPLGNGQFLRPLALSPEVSRNEELPSSLHQTFAQLLVFDSTVIVGNCSLKKSAHLDLLPSPGVWPPYPAHVLPNCLFNARTSEVELPCRGARLCTCFPSSYQNLYACFLPHIPTLKIPFFFDVLQNTSSSHYTNTTNLVRTLKT